ncbi:MAG: RDD family protein [Steroidobacteraceae bacterium]
MNKQTRWFLVAALLAGMSGCAAPAQAGQAVVSTSGDGATVTASSSHGATEVQIGASGINVTNGSSHLHIGGTGSQIISRSRSVIVIHSHHSCPHGQEEVVAVGHLARLAAGKSACDVVSIFGDSIIDGNVSDSAVAIMGDLHLTGNVGNSTVSIFGDSDINGPVAGNAVALFGDLKLGPKAMIQGQAVSIFGSEHRDPAAVVQGGSVNLMSGIFHGAHGLKAWAAHCLILGRLLAPRLDLGWAWGIALGILMFYALLALLFHEGVQRCIQTLDEHPGASILAALAMALLTPILMLALVVTLIGIFAIPLFWLALLGTAVFGRVVALGWLGSRILRGMRSGVTHPALYVLLGGAVALALYMVPVVGFIVFALIGVLGFGAVLYSLLLAMRAARGGTPSGAAAGGFTAPAEPLAAAGPDTAAASAGSMPGTAEPAGAAPGAPEAPMDFTTLPRAGFWIRMLALLIDVVLVAFALSMIEHHGTDGMLLLLAAYGAIMWKLRGTTVGGIICHLRVVRIDGRPMNWETAILRALGCFLSLVAAGLGFFWIAFDRERQGWHDKIAGTVVVLVPKARGLV